MNVQFYNDQPFWMILVAVAVGFGLAFLLYFKNKNQKYSKPLTLILFFMRAIAVSLLVSLLFNIYLLQTSSLVEQPTIVFAHDNSSSVVLSKDSTYYKTEYLNKYQSVKNIISKECQIDEFVFGQSARKDSKLDFSDQQTDFSELFSVLKRQYYKKNVGAVVLLSDGIFNKGYEPDLALTDFEFPIYTVALGDTNVYPDLSVFDLRYNKTITRNNEFSIEATVKALNCKGNRARISLSMDGKRIDVKSMTIPSNRFSQTVVFRSKSENEGIKKMEIELEGIEDETQTLNNKKVFYIDVKDRKFNVLMMAKAPHPDLSAIKNALGDDFNVDIRFLKDGLPSDKNFDLILLHQLPDGTNSFNLIEDYLKKNEKLPIFFIVGKEINIQLFNKIQSFLNIKYYTPLSYIDCKATLNENFSLFGINEDLKTLLKNIPPISVPYAVFQLNGQSDILLTQQIRNIETNEPLICFGKSGQRKVGVFSGTGLWRWMLNNFYQTQNHNCFDELISKSVHYLLLENDKELLKVIFEKEYFVGNQIQMEAELRNQSNELTPNADISIVIHDEVNNLDYPFVFSSNNERYFLNIGYLPESVYSFEASTTIGSTLLKNKGYFNVLASSLESQNLTANYDLMSKIAQLTNGTSLTHLQIDQLPEIISSDNRIASISREETLFRNLIDLKYLCLLIIVLLSAEWILRKTFGAY